MSGECMLAANYDFYRSQGGCLDKEEYNDRIDEMQYALENNDFDEFEGLCGDEDPMLFL